MLRLMMGTPSTTRSRIGVSTAVLAAFAIHGCATLPGDYERVDSYAFLDTDGTRLGRSANASRAEHPGKSGALLLGNGLDAFVARAALTEVAERSLDVQYYLYHDDLTGRLLMHDLIEAADRGVRVRLLVDDMDLGGRDFGIAALDTHPNLEVRIFNPFSRNVSRATQLVTRFGSVTRRMHNKSFTADNQVSILGGRNIGNEYFDADPDLKFGDLDVALVGPVVKDVSEVFDLYWNSPLAYPASVLVRKLPSAEEVIEARKTLDEYVASHADSQYLVALRESELARAIENQSLVFRWGDAAVVYDHPEKLSANRKERQYHLVPQLEPYLSELDEELIIFSPYFVPGKSGSAFLEQLCAKGVRVRILTNSLASTDVPIVHSGYVGYRKALLRAGVELYELSKRLSDEEREEMEEAKTGSSKASLHAKSFVFDREQVFIGSLNVDPRSVVENSEIGTILNSPEIATGLAGYFDENIGRLAFRLELENGRILWHGFEAGEPVTYDREPYAGFWFRCWVGFLRILPVESQL